MKTLVLLALCCFLRIGTDAILAEEMSMLKSQILENLKTNGKKTIYIFLFVFDIHVYILLFR